MPLLALRASTDLNQSVILAKARIHPKKSRARSKRIGSVRQRRCDEELVANASGTF